MALGIEPNSIAPQLIAQSGKMLSDNIRDIGKQVQSSIFEINTRKDLAAMAQEIQGGAVIPQSEDFAQQAVAFGFRHPLAIQDPRGQMALNVLGKAHGEWKQGQMLQQKLEGQLSGIQARGQSSLAQIAARTQGMQETEKMRQEGRTELENTRQGNRLGLQDARTEGQLKVLDARQNAPMNPAKSASLRLRETAQRRAIINDQVSSVERDIRALEQSLRSADKMSATPEEKLAWQKQVEGLRDQRNKLLEELRTPPEITPESELGAELPDPNALPPVPPNAVAPQGDGVLPEPGAVAAPASNTEFVLVFDPSGKPGKVRASQLESALANGYRRR